MKTSAPICCWESSHSPPPPPFPYNTILWLLFVNANRVYSRLQLGSNSAKASILQQQPWIAMFIIYTDSMSTKCVHHGRLHKIQVYVCEANMMLVR